MGLRWRFWFWVLVLCASVDARAAGCEAAGAGAASASMRMISVKQDAVLGSRWGLILDCAHPEWPSRWVMLTASEELKVEAKVEHRTAAVRGPMVVRAGETVRAWLRDGMASIETSGVAEQSGAAGARIQVRLLRRGM